MLIIMLSFFFLEISFCLGDSTFKFFVWINSTFDKKINCKAEREKLRNWYCFLPISFCHFFYCNEITKCEVIKCSDGCGNNAWDTCTCALYSCWQLWQWYWQFGDGSKVVNRPGQLTDIKYNFFASN